MSKINNNNLSVLFNPQSIAVVGVSRDENKVGHIVFKNIINGGYKGQVYPVNPGASQIDGITCYKNYGSLPTAPELALVAIPAPLVTKELVNIAAKGTTNVVIYSAGFKEVGENGSKMEDEIKKIALKYKLNILGPNCLGFVNSGASLNATFIRASLQTGNLRFISQSGALASSMFDWACDNKLGFDSYISIGNKAAINETDLLKYLITNLYSGQKSTGQNLSEQGYSKYSPVGLYLESINNGVEFIRLAQKICLHNPIFILKPGKSDAAKLAMQSHTGAMAGDNAVLDAALQKAGVIRCNESEDLFDLAKICSWENAPEGPNLVIISNAGGPGAIASDVIKQEGLNMAVISQKTRQKLLKSLPAAASIYNPIDILGDASAELYKAALEATLLDDGVDAALVILTPQLMTQIVKTAEVIADIGKKFNKPIICSFMGGCQTQAGEDILNKYKIPSFKFPERAIKALAKMWRWQEWRIKNLNIKPAYAIFCAAAPNNNRQALNSDQAIKLISKWQISIPPEQVVKSAVEAKNFAIANDWPVVLKYSSPKILHKTEFGAVAANIANLADLTQTFNNFINKFKNVKKFGKGNVIIQKQVFGVEVIVGVKRDPNFGAVLMFGAGGALAELVGDINLCLLPVGLGEVKKLVAQSKIYKLLTGFRGSKPLHLDDLYQTMIQLAKHAEHLCELKEVEINPLIVSTDGVYAVDARVIIN